MQLQLYFHFPFCKRKCSYCDFCSAPGSEAEMYAYCDALVREIRERGESLGCPQVSTVFLGGGTPSVLPPDALDSVLRETERCFCILPDAEMTCEANPGTLSMPWLETVASHGVNRLSLGVQAAQDRLLKSLGRIHTFRDAEEAFRMAKAAGIRNLNADLMFALPGQTPDDFKETVDLVCGQGITHVSAYSLILEESTPLFQEVAAGLVTVPDDDAAADFCVLGKRELEKRGFYQYEISNYAKDGFRCRHNVGYWQGAWYLGLGVSAHSMLPPDIREAASGAVRVRKANGNNMHDYITALLDGGAAPGETNLIALQEAMFETVMTGLRMNDGVNAGAFRERYGRDLVQVYGEALESLIRDELGGWLPGGAFALNERGMLLQNQALLRFMEDEKRL